MLSVTSWASGQYFSMLCRRSQSSFLGPSKPFLGFRPWRKTCSNTMKKCWRGRWSESSCLPYRNDCSSSSFTTSLQIFTRFDRSIAAGSRAKQRSKFYCSVGVNDMFSNSKKYVVKIFRYSERTPFYSHSLYETRNECNYWYQNTLSLNTVSGRILFLALKISSGN